MTSQQHADAALARWQELRHAGLTPDQRIEELMRSFFAPPPLSDFEYQFVLNRVHEEMSQ